MNLRSLLKLKAREKTILLSYQYSNRVAEDLRNAGLKVIVLPPRKYINLAQDVEIATFPIISTVDSVLLIKSKKNLIVNCNDTNWDPSMDFVKKEVSKSNYSLLLKLAGYGDADMINIYKNDEFIEPLAATKPAPGYLLTSQAKKLNCTHAMHFSSFHKYIRTDSIWANKYTTPENDLRRGWDKQIGYFKQFSSLLISEKGFTKLKSVYPSKNDMPVQTPEKYGDKWDEELTENDELCVREYLNKIAILNKNYFSIKVGKKFIKANDFNSANNKVCFTLEAPRFSLIRSIKLNIFDDLLIGNFAKVLIPRDKLINFRNILKIPSKYVDNANISNLEELKEFLWIYRNSYDNKIVQIRSELKENARDIITSKFIGNYKFLGNLKKIYQKL